MKGIDFTQDKSIFLDKKVKVFPSGIYQNTDEWNFKRFFNYKVKSLRTTS